LAQKTLSAGETAVQYFLGDALSSVRQLTDATEIILTKRYRPFGETMDSAGDGTTAYAFTGEWHDYYIKLQYLRSRWYSPQIGRFTTKDSWQGHYTRPLTLNSWSYVENNPVNLTDPSGYSSILPTACIWGTAKECVDYFKWFYSKEGPIEQAGQVMGGIFDCSNRRDGNWSIPQTTMELATDYICERGPEHVIFYGMNDLTQELVRSILIARVRDEFYRSGDIRNARELKFNVPEYIIAWLDALPPANNGAIPRFPITQFLGSFDYMVYRLPSGRVKYQIDNQTDMASGTHFPGRFPPESDRYNPLSMEWVIDEHPDLESMNSMKMILTYVNENGLKVVSVLRPKTRRGTGGTGSGVMKQTFTWTERYLDCGLPRFWPAYLPYLDVR